MSARIGQNFSYNAKDFLDYRQGYPKTTADLKAWTVPVPEGFEVCLDNTWYYYDSTQDLEETGHWIPRVATSIDDTIALERAASLGLLKDAIKDSDTKRDEILKRLDEFEGILFPATFNSIVIGSWYTQDNKDQIAVDQDSVRGDIINHVSNTNLPYDKNLDFNGDNIINSTDLSLADSSFQAARDSLSYNSLGTGATYNLEVGSYVIPKITWSIKRKGKVVNPIVDAEVTGGSGGWVESTNNIFHGKEAITSSQPRSFTYNISAFATSSIYAEGTASVKFLYKCYYGSAPASFLKSKYSASVDFINFNSFFTESSSFPKSNFDCTGGKYPYIFIPSQYFNSGVKIYVNGMYNTDFNFYDCNVINNRGIQIPYKIIRTGIIQTGNPIPIQII